jgi:hypothetical protein
VCATAPAFSGPACLFTVPGGIPLSHFSIQGAPPSLLLVLIVLIAYYSVSLFFPGWGSICPGGYAALAHGCLWEYQILLSSFCVPHLPKPSGCWCLVVARGALLVSLFSMKWRCSAHAGGVEGSKFCLFWVIFPVMYISSFSPRFYFRRHAFCFLPLATILESSIPFL